MNVSKILIYTKGCSKNNGKPEAIAAYGAILIAVYDNGKCVKKPLSGLVHPINATNIRAEIVATYKALKAINHGFRDIHVTVYTSCRYITGVINDKWYTDRNVKAFLELEDEMDTFSIRPDFEWISSKNEMIIEAKNLTFGEIAKYEQQHILHSS